MGNVLGSNISNLLVIVGIVAMIQPIAVPAVVQLFDYPAMLLFAGLLLPLALRQRLQGWSALALLMLYAVFIALTLARA
jgi:cation:H+ antiporter